MSARSVLLTGATGFVEGTCSWRWPRQFEVRALGRGPPLGSGPDRAAKDGTLRILDSDAEEVGLLFAWGRLSFLYGPDEKPWRLVSDALRALKASEGFKTSLGHQRRTSATWGT